jgi:putative radical SAM enzyme (TIGR03279 family)
MLVRRIEPGSEAALAGVQSDDDLVAVAGRPVGDSLDLAFVLGWVDDELPPWEFVRGGESASVVLPTRGPDDLGIEFAPDAVRTCGNRCTFCFVDQLPRGLRPSLYVRDEDYRLSFTLGNYLTLTNLTDADYERIARQRLSPLYVSVHATDDVVRRRTLGNANAPAIIPSLERLAADGIRVHTQIVVCPGVNDGAVLEDTLGDLLALGETVLSVAVVPVGLTVHREGLPVVEAVSREKARELLDAVERWQRRFEDARGEPVVFAADEIYLRAGRELPPHDRYGDFPQIENGVGLLRSFEADLAARAADLDGGIASPLSVVVVTGTAAAAFLSRAIDAALADVRNLDVRVLAVENGLFGPSVTVAGLLPGQDLAAAIAAAAPADLFLIPGEVLNEDELTLDGMTVDEIASETGKGDVVATDDLVGAVLDRAGARPAAAGEGDIP